MTGTLRRLLVHLSSFALAGVLLYLALRGVDAAPVADALRKADYRWLAPLVALALGSHLLRAWRWRVLLEALPPRRPGGAAPRVSLKTAFYSVMIGYMVNYAAPRLGEVVRTGNLSIREDLRFGRVLGTVVVERVLDVALLVLALLVTLLLLSGRLARLSRLLLDPLRGWSGGWGTGGLLLAAAVVGLAAALGAMVLWAYRRGQVPYVPKGLWRERVRPALVSFGDGLLTLVRSPRRGALVLSTLAMWGCYLVMAYLPLLMFGMTGAYGLGLSDAWVLMTLGAVGVSIPTPGGVGSYHYITVQALVHLFGTPQAPAATYAVVVHAFQLVLYSLVGGACLLLQGSSLRALRQAASGGAPADDAPGARDPAPAAGEDLWQQRAGGA